MKKPSLDWHKAAGPCGFNTRGAVHAVFARDVALFAFESALSRPTRPVFTCIVTGHTAVNARSLEAAQVEGEGYLRCVRPLTGARNLTHQKFVALTHRRT